jgi:exosortase
VTTALRWPRWFSVTLACALVLMSAPVVLWAGKIWFDGILGGAAAALLSIPIAIVLGVLGHKRLFLERPPRTGADLVLGVALLVYGLILAVGGHGDAALLSAGVVIPAAVWTWLWGSYGWSFARVLVFPCAFTLFALPWEHFVRGTIELSLQAWTADIAVWFLQLAGYVVWYYNDHTIDSEPFYLIVNETCSGVNMLVALTMYTLIFAWLVQPRFRARFILIALVFPLAMLANGLRVLTIFLLGYYGGIEWADGFWHTGSAYLIFLPLFWFMYIVNQALNRVYGTTVRQPKARE